MRKYIYILFFFSTPFSGIANNNDDFDKVFDRVVIKFLNTDINKAFEIADSLLENAQNSYQEVKSTMLLATLHENNGKLAKSFILAQNALEIAKNSNLYEWEARIVGYFSSHYRKLEMYEEGWRYLNQSNDFIPKIEDDNIRNMYNGFILNEQGRFHLAQESYERALFLVEEGLISFERMEEGRNKPIFINGNYILTGQILLRLKEWARAKLFFEKSIALSKKYNIDEAYSSIFVSLGLSNANLKLKNYDEALSLLEDAKEMITSSNSDFLRVDLYEGYKYYYKELDDLENYKLYSEKYLSLLSESEKRKGEAIQRFINETNEYKVSVKKSSKKLIIVLILLFTTLVLIVFLFMKKIKKDKKGFSKVLEKTESNSLSSQAQGSQLDENSKNKEYVQIPENVKLEILNKLKTFEEGKEFLSPTFSLSSLSNYVETNEKYLSYVLNNYKHKNYNVYINELRIDYIIQMLKTEPKFRNYKIGQLAEKCGFSSHSKFSSVFKSSTSLSPSEYLKRYK